MVNLDVRSPESGMSITVISSDMWLDRPHGASVIRMFERLAEISSWDIELYILSKREMRGKKGSFKIIGLEVPSYLKESSIPYFAYAMNKSLGLMKRISGTVIFDYPLIPSFIAAKIVNSSLKSISLILSRPIYNNPPYPKNLAYKTSLLIGRFFIDKFTAITPFEAKEIGKLVGKDKVFVLPSMLAPEFLSPSKDCEYLLERHLNGLISLLKSNNKVLLYHGILDERRGLESILKSFTKAFRGKDILLALLGKGSAVPLVKKYQEMNPKILYLGSVPLSIVPCVIQLASAGISWLPDEPIWRYQLPTKVLEFMAMEKPFISNKLPGILWAANDCPLATYLDHMTPEGLKRSVDRTFRLRDLDSTCKKRAEKFSADNIAKSLREIIELLNP